jgi:hypothetical protein
MGRSEIISNQENNIRLNKRLGRVITHPKADSQFKKKIDDLLTNYLWSIKREGFNISMSAVGAKSL